MAIFINLLGIFDRFYRDQPIGCSLLGHLHSPSPSGFNRPNLLQNLNKSYHKN